MSLDLLQTTAWEFVNQLAHGDYESLVGRCVKSSLTSDDLRKAIDEYGRTLVVPPLNAYKELDAVKVNGATVPTWSVRAPLWTEEEGRSDLTLELTVTTDLGVPSVNLDDLHVFDSTAYKSIRSSPGEN